MIERFAGVLVPAVLPSVPPQLPSEVRFVVLLTDGWNPSELVLNLHDRTGGNIPHYAVLFAIDATAKPLWEVRETLASQQHST